MSGVYKKNLGFTLLEIVVAIAIIALMATLVIPRFGRKKTERDIFIHDFNALLVHSYNNALMTGKIQKVVWDVDKKSISVETATDERDSSGALKFKPLQAGYVKKALKIPDEFSLKNFFIKGKDELLEGPTKKLWFYIMPSGIAQEIIINIFDTKTEQEIGMILNPFTVQVKVYDQYQKP